MLQGLIAWRRDSAAAVVPAEPETPTAAEAQQQQAASIAPARPSGPLCTDTADEDCWMELDSLPDCYVWNPNPQLREIDSWSGQCSDGLGTGTGTGVYTDNRVEGTGEIPYVKGVLHGKEVLRWVNGTVVETPWVNGEIHGTQIIEYGPDSRHAVREWPFVNGVIHGTAVERHTDGRVIEFPYVNGEIHGTQTSRLADGSVWERVWVNGDPVSNRRCVAGCD